MAKKNQKNGSQGGHQHGGGNSGKRGDIAANTKSSEDGRTVKRQYRNHQEEVRERELASGTFYSRVNGDRSNDILAAINGEPGEYAYPGGNQPSVLFRVSIVLRKYDGEEVKRIPVIFFEAAERGHEFQKNGRIIDPRTFLPCYNVERYGEMFTSRLEDAIARSAQEDMCRYLARETWKLWEESREVSIKANLPETIEEIYNRSSHNLIGILDDVPGLYGVKTENGIVIFELFHGVKVGVKVYASSDPRLVASRTFLLTYLIRHKQIKQVISEEIHNRQLAIWNFLREHLAQELASEKMTGTKSNDTPAQDLLEILRGNAISIAAAATGRLGYVDLSGTEGDLIVQNCVIRNDHAVRVELISDHHLLRLVGVEKGMLVYTSDLQRGDIDRYEKEKCSIEKQRARKAFIDFVTKKMAAVGVKFATPKKPDLRLVANF